MLAAKGTAAESALGLAGPDNLAGKVVIDAMNPIADAPPTNGALKFFTTLDDSLILWCLPGLLRGQWTHAFKLLKK